MRIPVSRSVSFSEVRQSLRKGLSSSRLARVLRTSFGLRRLCVRPLHRTSWTLLLFSSAELLKLDSVARTRHSLDLRILVIEPSNRTTYLTYFLTS